MKPTIRKVGHRWVLRAMKPNGGMLELSRPSWDLCVGLLPDVVLGFRLLEAYAQKFERFERKPPRVEVGE